jgi:long-chain acyl-CoA synthetase
MPSWRRAAIGLQHLLRARGLCRLDHYAIFMENNARYLECCAAGVRAGLYYTCVNSFLTPNELAYILKKRIQTSDHLASQAQRGAGRAGAMPQD